MPTYEYRCSAGHQYETREGFDAPAKQKCEKCGKTANRMIFAPPIVFKGNGFYKTDSRASSDGDKPEAAPAPPAPAASKDDGHSHGAGGHSHGPEAAPEAVESTAAS